ncbi:MAG: hypothetical protein GY862_02250 [Gammaproteobacteria bacterium]|nr:hypothetical protein [Gammaproteobacteria bacterium]
MQTVNVEVPDAVWESCQRNMQTVKAEVKHGFVIWEYLNGRLSLRECSELLCMSYRNFLELLWSKGIPIDGLSEEEVRIQADNLHQRLGSE